MSLIHNGAPKAKKKENCHQYGAPLCQMTNIFMKKNLVSPTIKLGTKEIVVRLFKCSDVIVIFDYELYL